MEMTNIEQITNTLQKLVYFSYKAFLKTNNGFEIEDERNGYESEQFADDIQVDCGIQFWKATTERYGADYTLHYEMADWLSQLFSTYKLPLTFTSELKNGNGGDQAYINSLAYVGEEIEYDLTALSSMGVDDLQAICNKLEAQLSYLTLKYQ